MANFALKQEVHRHYDYVGFTLKSSHICFFSMFFRIVMVEDFGCKTKLSVKTQWMSHHIAQALFKKEKCFSKHSRGLKTCHLFSRLASWCLIYFKRCASDLASKSAGCLKVRILSWT